MDFFRHRNFKQIESEHPHLAPLPRVQVQAVEVVHSGLLQESRVWLSPCSALALTQLRQGCPYPVSASKHEAPVPHRGAGVGGSGRRRLPLGDRDRSTPGDSRASAQLTVKGSKEQSEKTQPVNHPVCSVLMDGRPGNSLKMGFISSLFKCINFAFRVQPLKTDWK